MTESQKTKVLSPQDKQYTVLPNETDPKASLAKAMSAAIKAKIVTKKIRKPSQDKIFTEITFQILWRSNCYIKQYKPRFGVTKK